MCTSLCLLLLSGCASYEYDLVKPGELATHIGGKHFSKVGVDPLIYEFEAVDNRLVMFIRNPTDDEIQLLGVQSSIVDQKGESHPIQGGMIAPGSHIKRILPPMPPEVRPSGPSLGIGFGVRADSGYWQDAYYGPWYGAYYPPRYSGWYAPYYYPPYYGPYGGYPPMYLAVYDDDNALYWQWHDETDVRMVLRYQRGQKTFEHAFTFHRRKM
jgi:hypothetical protein